MMRLYATCFLVWAGFVSSARIKSDDTARIGTETGGSKGTNEINGVPGFNGDLSSRHYAGSKHQPPFPPSPMRMALSPLLTMLLFLQATYLSVTASRCFITLWRARAAPRMTPSCCGSMVAQGARVSMVRALAALGLVTSRVHSQLSRVQTVALTLIGVQEGFQMACCCLGLTMFELSRRPLLHTCAMDTPPWPVCRLCL